jgi:hypothetical protein
VRNNLRPAPCITGRVESCGRAGLELAVAHATERATALGVRQTIRIQRSPGVGLYFVIRSAR